MSYVFFMGGVHGVGKTTIAKSVADQMGFITATCSSIIRDEQSSNALSIPNAGSIDRNQEALVRGVEKMRGKGRPLLLDGHFSLLASGVTPTEIPISFFHELNPDGIILIEEIASEIVRRIWGRDGQLISILTMEERILFERNCALNVAKEMNQELWKSNSDPAEFCSQLTLMIK